MRAAQSGDMRDIILCVVFLTLGAVLWAFDQSSLSGPDRLQADNHLLKVQLAQCQEAGAAATSQLTAIRLTAERAALVEQFRKALQPPPGADFDWSTLTFKVKAVP